jgi:hypothetical protein
MSLKAEGERAEGPFSKTLPKKDTDSQKSTGYQRA